MAQVVASESPAADALPTNVLIVGTGGQGVIMVSKILARLSQLHDFQVKQSEVHGMAKRGGSVFSHVRFGPQVWASTIPVGEADVLIALEWAEGLRWLPYLNPRTGTLIVDTKRIVPPFACLDRRPGGRLAYPVAEVAEVVAKVPRSIALDAEGIARGVGNARAANAVLLGVASNVFEFPIDEWESVLNEFVPPKTRTVNLDAFAAGRVWVDDEARRSHEGEVVEAPSPDPQSSTETYVGSVSLEITPSWCKSCDICVKMCPEMCLRLDDHQIVELTDPAACTGCRICEWLCPDFAIKVDVREPAAEIG